VDFDEFGTTVGASFEWNHDPSTLYEMTFSLSTPAALALGTIQRAIATRLDG
jgi:hypothetical protein